MKVLDHHPHEHVQDEEADQEDERDEVEQPPLGVVDDGLLVQTHCVQTVVHDVNPTVPRAQHEERHQRLAQIVEIVLLVLPVVVATDTVVAVRDSR